jgi:hypothetical protein
VTRVETILEEAAEKGFIFRESDHAVANIAGREDAILAAQAAGTAPVIRDSHNSGEVRNGVLGGGVLVSAADYVFLEPAKECGKTGTATKRDDAEAAVKNFRFGPGLFHFQMAASAYTSLYRKGFNA